MSTTYAKEDWYDTPRGYDLVFDEDTPEATDFLERVYSMHGHVKGARGPRRVFEPACGSGRLMVEFARRGWRVSGSDLSQPMLDYARERLDELGLPASLSLGDMAEPRPRGRFHLAHCLVSTFKYLLQERQARGNLAGMAQVLHPGGLYVLGLHLTDYATTSLTRERWVVERDGTHVVCNIQGWPADRKRRVERVRSRLIVRERGQERRTETVWDFRTYDVRQLSRLLASVPQLEHVATYDFRYDVNEPCIFGVDQVDTILVLRRR